ncbi:MAG: agmatinase family protein [Candidatus Competibacteraceae bacterium]|jgi:agmatinase|nr:agmatinase family protein [Candidatus Competibacteraceae bacterium]
MKRCPLFFLLASALTIPTAYAQVMGAADTPAEIDPIDEGEQPIIKLNPDDPSYDVWKKLRDFSKDRREPGPINVQRFEGHVPWVGIPTFFHLPVALTPEDLKAGKVEVAIMGAELIGDMRARSYGPMEMRNPHRSEVYHNWGSFTMPDLDTGVNPLQELTIVDYGDAPIEPMSIERTIPEVRKFVRQIAEVEIEPGKRTIPIIIGGGHALMFPDVAGLVDVYGKGKIGIVHFDAHADQAPVGFGHLITHGNPVRQLVDAGLVEGKNIIQVGLRGPNSTDMNGVAWNRENKLRYHMMAEVERRGWEAVMKDVLKEALEGVEYLFVSFDIDVVDPAFIPGTSTPEPGGLYMREVMPLMRGLCTHPNLVGVEIVELRPDSDPGYTTMLNTKAILRRCLEGITLRKNGITDPLYLHPELVDDGQG